MQEFSASPELPRFSDRLPDLAFALREAARSLETITPNQSYLPFWEDIYLVAHSLKGVLDILACPPDMATFILRLNDTLVDGLAGTAVCRRLGDAGKLFSALSQQLDCDSPAEKCDFAFLQAWLGHLRETYTKDINHEERLKGIPPHLFYVNEFVSKKAREIPLLQLNQCVVEDDILLDDIPLWRTQLNEALLSPEFGRGVVINFLPFLSSEGSRTLNVWAWVAAATHSRAALKQRLKEIMPKASLATL